jgi:hypothetical protein
MYHVRTPERRSGLNRRISADHNYIGPERRKLKFRRIGLDRRGTLPTVCIYCGQIRSAQGEWQASPESLDPAVKPRTGICTDCSKEKFPQFYSGI